MSSSAAAHAAWCSQSSRPPRRLNHRCWRRRPPRPVSRRPMPPRPALWSTIAGSASPKRSAHRDCRRTIRLILPISPATRRMGWRASGLPSARAARELVVTLTGPWSAAELPHRVSQMFVEGVLRTEAAACCHCFDPPRLADERRCAKKRRVALKPTRLKLRQSRLGYVPPTRSAPTARSPTRKTWGYELNRRKRRGSRFSADPCPIYIFSQLNLQRLSSCTRLPGCIGR